MLTVFASGDFCFLLIIFANSLDPDQGRQNVGPDLVSNLLTLIFLEEIFLKKFVLKIVSKRQQSIKNHQAYKELMKNNAVDTVKPVLSGQTCLKRSHKNRQNKDLNDKW